MRKILQNFFHLLFLGRPDMLLCFLYFAAHLDEHFEYHARDLAGGLANSKPLDELVRVSTQNQ